MSRAAWQRRSLVLAAVLLVAATFATAQTPAPAPATAHPAPPASPVSAIRNKLSADDLLSAESILEVYRDRNGVDGNYLVGLSWLARGALMLGDPAKARRYADDVRTRCADSLGHGADMANNGDLELALGAADEVEAQLIARKQGKRAAAAFLRAELARFSGPVTLRARLQKRLNMLTMAGTPAPELVIEDFVGAAPPPPLESLRGSPVVIFLWAEGCGDCKASAPALAHMRARYAAQGLRLITLTRYPEGADVVRPTVKARVDSVWKAVYTGLGDVPTVLSTASAVQYGGSSTPTFIFIDRKGIVRGYTPTRLTEAELDREVARILR